jgi:hypothetical protein
MSLRKPLLFLLAIVMLVSCASATAVFGFWPEYIDNTDGGQFSEYQPDWGNLTHIVFSVVKVYPSGQLDTSKFYEDLYRGVYDNATKNNVTVVIMVWPESFTNDCFNSIINTNRTKTINSLAQFMDDNNASGLCLDFEFFSDSSSFRATMPTFLNDLNDEMESYNPDAELSICIMGGGDEVVYQNTSVANNVDYAVLMGYDYRNGHAATTGPVSPINSIISSLNTMELYYPPNKIILGLPIYGYEWECDSQYEGANTTSNYEAKRLYQALTEGENYTINRDAASGNTPWYAYYSGSHWYQCWYDDNVSLGNKIDQVIENTELGGIGFWALGFDANYPATGIIQMASEKLNAVDNAFIGTTVTQSASHHVSSSTQIGQSIPSNQTVSLKINLSSSAQNPYTERSGMNLSAWWKIDEGTGTSLADATGNGHTGTTSGTVSWATTGKYNQSLYCDGSTGHYTVPVTGDTDISGKQFSISAWLNPRDTIPETDVFTLADSVTDRGLEMYASGGTWKIQYMNASYTYTLSGGTKQNDTWQHIAASVNATHLNMYYNGARVNSTPIVEPLVFPESQEFWIMRTVGRGYTRGWIDDVVLKTNTPLTTAQMTQLYHDPLISVKSKTNTNATYSGYWNSSSDNPISIPISSLDGMITTLSHTVPTNVTIENIKTYYYTPEHIAPEITQVHTEDVVLLVDDNNTAYHNVSLLHRAQYNSTSGIIRYELNDSIGGNIALISTNPNATIAGNSTLFEISTGLVKSDTSYIYNISVEHPNVVSPGIHEGYWQKWTGTGWDFVDATPTNNSASLAGQLEVMVS